MQQQHRRRVIVIGEDYERAVPILEALDALGVAVQMWNVTRGALHPTAIPEDAVYFCRQSPSSLSRGHASSISYVRALLLWMQRHGRTVVNGVRAFEVEMSKAAQMALLHAHGINTPATLLVATSYQLLVELSNRAAARGGGAPVILKPDTGGSGLGVAAFASAAAAADATRARMLAERSPAGEDLWVLQEHMNPYSDDVAKIRSILRFEIVGGRVLYIMQIRAPVTVFKLCPCDPKMESILSKIDFRIVPDPFTIPCFRDDPPSYSRFCAKIEAVWHAMGAHIGSVEAFLPVCMAEDALTRAYSAEAQVTPGEPVVFEINLNSNYNTTAEGLAGVCGAREVAKLLAALAHGEAPAALFLPEL